MNRTELHQKTKDVLFKAYFDDTLEHSNCAACAVGNICGGEVLWSILFMTWEDGEPRTFEDIRGMKVLSPSYGKYRGRIIDEQLRQEALAIIANTGYAVEELMLIERAFEMADKGENEEDHMFNGLVAVLEVLKDIHGVDDAGVEPFAEVHKGRKTAFRV